MKIKVSKQQERPFSARLADAFKASKKLSPEKQAELLVLSGSVKKSQLKIVAERLRAASDKAKSKKAAAQKSRAASSRADSAR